MQPVSHQAVVYAQGDRCGSVFRICDGQIKLAQVNRDGNELTIGLLSAGDMFGPGLADPRETEAQEIATARRKITLQVAGEHRKAAAAVYEKYRAPFLSTVTGAESKQLLIGPEDVQVLHGFDLKTHAEQYLQSALFQNDVVTALKPYLGGTPDIRIYESA